MASLSSADHPCANMSVAGLASSKEATLINNWPRVSLGSWGRIWLPGPQARSSTTSSSSRVVEATLLFWVLEVDEPTWDGHVLLRAALQQGRQRLFLLRASWVGCWHYRSSSERQCWLADDNAGCVAHECCVGHRAVAPKRATMTMLKMMKRQ
jgi:hypothetical protein